MVDKYRTSCTKCKLLYELEYGRKNNNLIIEIFSCPSCKNLFSLPSNGKEIKCPQCGNKKLDSYNMQKEKNLLYYNKMLKNKILSQSKYNTLVSYWEKIKSKQCPKCGEDTLIWNLYKKNI